MQPTFTIFQGNSKTMYLRVEADDCCGNGPVDLTNCTEIDVALPNADGTFAHLLKSEGDVVITSPAVLGKFSVPIDTEVSELLNVGVGQPVDVTFTVSGEIFTVRFQQALSVYELN